MRTVSVSSTQDKFRQEIAIGDFHLIADEPADFGGGDAGPAPHDFLLAGLGACKAMTVKMYAERKGWPLRSVRVDLTQEKEGSVHKIAARLIVEGDLNEEQRQRLLEIADKCPVHKTLTSAIEIRSYY